MLSNHKDCPLQIFDVPGSSLSFVKRNIMIYSSQYMFYILKMVLPLPLYIILHYLDKTA